jgi:hypothetical protein
MDIGMSRTWRIIIGLAVPSFAILIVAGIATIVGDGRGSELGDASAVAFIVATLGGLIVIPGTAALARIA